MSSIMEFFSYNRSVLSGAVDIIAVRHSDDCYKISPFRVRFGSFKVLKAKEKIVNILINKQRVDLTMRLSENGEAYFMHEIMRIAEDTNYISDCYSPVETGNSAPSSPKAKLTPGEIKKFTEMNIINLDVKEMEVKAEIIELKELKEDNNKDVLIDVVTEIKEKEINIEVKEEESVNESIDQLSVVDSPMIDAIELEAKKHHRKMSFDVMSRDEKTYKFRPVRENSFSIESGMSMNMIEKSSMKINLSDSWNLISKGKENLEDIFSKNKITKEDFFKDPWKVLNNANLAIRHEDYVYTWKVIAPIIVSKLAFNEDLPSNVITSLTQQQQGFFLWKRVNLDAFKIDIKKKKEEGLLIKDVMSTPTKGVKEKTAPNLDDSLINEASPKKVTVAEDNKNLGHLSTDTSPHPKHIDQRRHIHYKKTYTISSEQIKALNLNKGKNEISFVVSSKIQGTHILTSDLYLWDCEDKILISDLDGTITRSDVLGHFLPYLGKDWSHKGVVKLFNEIDKNGYKIIYLTARSISQSYQTKNYLRNKLIQNKLKVPEGPILMSPDGIISSLKREVIDRIPQSFKIDCLTQIVNLFPPDSYPFYAGFGNRHTDAISYEAVGVSKNKIFIINEKGEISQYNNHYKTSYVTINENVNEMFPPLTSNNTFFGSLSYFKPSYGNINLQRVFD